MPSIPQSMQTAPGKKRGAPRGSPIISLARKLEDDLTRHLHVATAKERRRHIWKLHVGFAEGGEQICVIEHVVGFKAALQSVALGQLEVLVQRRINIREAGR